MIIKEKYCSKSRGEVDQILKDDHDSKLTGYFRFLEHKNDLKTTLSSVLFVK